jgi:peptidoglycan/LPS O-acetylase OafA/YrhL
VKYRPEIDGLRAVAVLPVVFFHAGIGFFRGGFVGVDVFFVLSGYLITSLLVNELENDHFSLFEFYERRARRILPALFCVMLACLIPAWLLLPPHQLKDFSQSLVAVSGFGSNILFWLESGYFEPAAELKPLLHTWSLAVEEQYYLLFPIIVVVAWRPGRWFLMGLLAVMSLASIVLAQWSSLHDPAANFYLLPTRAWELLAGALTALYRPPDRSADHDSSRLHRNDAWPVIGLGLVFASVFLFDERTPFPSLWGLFPVLGTVLVLIFARSDAGVGRWLASPVFLSIGLASYSLYLWHQPLLAFLRVHSGQSSLDTTTIAGYLLLSAALAALSYRYVERPFRSRHWLSRSVIFALSIGAALGFAIVGYAGHRTNGFLEQKLASVAPENRGLLVSVEEEERERSVVVQAHIGTLSAPSFIEDSRTRKILILGDSIAQDLATALVEHREFFPRHEFRYRLLRKECMKAFERASTPAVLHARRPDDCADLTDLAGSDLLEQSDLTIVTNLWKTGVDFAAVQGFLSSLQRVSREVLVLGGGGFIDIASVAYQIASRHVAMSQEAVDATVAASRRIEFDMGNERISSVATSLHMRYADRHLLYCNDRFTTCRILLLSGQSVLMDGAHLTRFGMRETARHIAALGWLNPVAVRPP